MISFLGSDPPKVFLLSYNTYIIIFRVCWTHKYFVLPLLVHFCSFYNFCLLIILVFRQPWKLTTNLFGYCYKNCQCLSFVLLCFCSSNSSALIANATILDVSGALILNKKKVINILLFNVPLSNQLMLIKITWRCT